MSGPSRGVAHLARAVALAAAVLALASGAHVAGGDVLPGPGALAVLALGTAWVCAWATRVRLAAPALLALLGGGQYVLHQALVSLAAAPACLPAGGHAGHGHAAALACEPAGHAAMGGGTSMLLAHALATLLTGALLARGEAALWALWRWLRPLPALPAPVSLPRPARPRRVPPAAPRPVRGAVLRVAPRRGPPRALRAA